MLETHSNAAFDPLKRAEKDKKLANICKKYLQLTKKSLNYKNFN